MEGESSHSMLITIIANNIYTRHTKIANIIAANKMLQAYIKIVY